MTVEGPLRRERYQMDEGYTREVIAQRTAAENAAFLLPHLSPGMRLLDCGCGPGSITLGLAEIVAPGEVVGIDLREIDLEHARALAEAQHVANTSFEVASVYALPFADGSFDAVVALRLLQHLGDPLGAMKEMRRVLAPGGIVGIMDPLWQCTVRHPSSPLLDAWDRLRPRSVAFHGGSPFYAPSQRALLREAGFSRTEGRATAGGTGGGGRPAGTLHDTRLATRDALARMPDVRQVALEQGWATPEELDGMAEALAAWGEDPDAFLLIPQCCAIGWA